LIAFRAGTATECYRKLTAQVKMNILHHNH